MAGRIFARRMRPAPHFPLVCLIWLCATCSLAATFDETVTKLARLATEMKPSPPGGANSEDTESPIAVGQAKNNDGKGRKGTALQRAVVALQFIGSKRDELDDEVLQELNSDAELLLGLAYRVHRREPRGTPQKQAGRKKPAELTKKERAAIVRSSESFASSFAALAVDIKTGGNGKVDVAMDTVQVREDERAVVDSWEVFFLSEGKYMYYRLNDDLEAIETFKRPFDNLSSPAKKEIRIGDYYVWASRGDDVSRPQRKEVRRPSSTSVLELQIVVP